jgi:CRISPR/Cas system-associated endoribonuclease Cas2
MTEHLETPDYIPLSYLNACTDRVRIYAICETCLNKRETVGIPEAKEETVYLI